MQTYPDERHFFLSGLLIARTRPTLKTRVRNTAVSLTGAYPKAEVLRGLERRRRWAVAEKLEMIAESREPGATVSLVARL